METVESIEPFEEELDLIQILTSVTDTVPKDDDDTLFRNQEEPSDVNEQFDVISTDNIQYSDDDMSHVSQQDLLNTLEDDEPCSENSSQHSNMSDCEDEEVETVDRSFYNLSLHESPEMSAQTLLSTFGFEKFVVPPLLSRHPPPATGRDDDVMKIMR